MAARIGELRTTSFIADAVKGREVAMQINPYLSFKGECEAAFTFYEQCLGGRRGAIFRYGGTPLASQVPADWSDKIMHGNLIFGDQVVMGGDVAPDHYEEPKGFSLSIHLKNTAEADLPVPPPED
jgi:PhnB protein